MSVILEDGTAADQPIPDGAIGFGEGYDTPRHVEQLDEICSRLGLPSFLGFVTVGEDDDPWFDPAAGLTCVRGLLQWLHATTPDERRRLASNTVWGQIRAIPVDDYDAVGPVVAAGVSADLRTFERMLAHAIERRTRFRLYCSC